MSDYIDELNARIAELEKEIKDKQATFEEQISRIAEEQESTNTSKEAKIKKYKAVIEEKSQKIEDLQEALENTGPKELRIKLKVQQSLSEKKAKEVTKLTTVNENLQKEMDKLRAKIKEGKGKGVKELQTQLDKKDAKIHELELKISDLESLQTELKTDQSQIVKVFDAQEATIKQLQALNMEQKNKIDQLSGGLDAQKLQSYENFIQQLQAELAGVRNQLVDSEGQRSEQAASIQRFEALMGQIETQITQQEQVAANITQQAPPVQASFQAQPPSQVQPIPAQTPSPTPTPSLTPAAPPSKPAEGPRLEAAKLLDTISQKAQGGMPGLQLGQFMEQTRNKIVEVFQWHPTLFELAAFARRLKQLPPEMVIDAETQNLLLEKINTWKTRILG